MFKGIFENLESLEEIGGNSGSLQSISLLARREYPLDRNCRSLSREDIHGDTEEIRVKLFSLLRVKYVNRKLKHTLSGLPPRRLVGPGYHGYPLLNPHQDNTQTLGLLRRSLAPDCGDL